MNLISNIKVILGIKHPSVQVKQDLIRAIDNQIKQGAKLERYWMGNNVENSNEQCACVVGLYLFNRSKYLFNRWITSGENEIPANSLGITEEELDAIINGFDNIKIHNQKEVAIWYQVGVDLRNKYQVGY